MRLINSIKKYNETHKQYQKEIKNLNKLNFSSHLIIEFVGKCYDDVLNKSLTWSNDGLAYKKKLQWAELSSHKGYKSPKMPRKQKNKKLKVKLIQIHMCNRTRYMAYN